MCVSCPTQTCLHLGLVHQPLWSAVPDLLPGLRASEPQGRAAGAPAQEPRVCVLIKDADHNHPQLLMP